ncbi:MAG: 4Fe-4S binding protein [Candidatus Wallbacteria bacterium]|nr:4Fe-4S binding protein [Candidatus Wallbacteria bacterium]
MIGCARMRFKFGPLFIPDVRKATLSAAFRGLPLPDNGNCVSGCNECLHVCPTGAISLSPLTIDMGKCVFCGDCVAACTHGAIRFSNFHHLATTERDRLKVSGISVEEYKKTAVTPPENAGMFRNSFKFRQVSAGGCSSCEMELNACSNVNFDMGRFGLEFVASPRHADGLVITGPISENMALALEDTYQAMPDPRIVIVVGACAISGGVFAESKALNRSFFDRHKVDLYIPGCPVHPLNFINGILDFLNLRK